MKIIKLQPSHSGMTKPVLQIAHEIILNAINRGSTTIRLKYGHTKLSIIELVPQGKHKDLKWIVTGQLDIRLTQMIRARFRILSQMSLKPEDYVQVGTINFNIVPWQEDTVGSDSKRRKIRIITVPNKKIGSDMIIDLINE